MKVALLRSQLEATGSLRSGQMSPISGALSTGSHHPWFRVAYREP